MGNQEISKKPLKSWYQEQHPLHKCVECGLEHHRLFPHIQKGDVTWIPFELVGVAEGTARMGLKEFPDLNAPGYVYALIWGIPGQGPLLPTVLVMN